MIKWKMANSNKFVGTFNDYEIIVTPFTNIYPHWAIMKRGIIIDQAQFHSPVTTAFNKELACKAQAEQYLQKIIANGIQAD